MILDDLKSIEANPSDSIAIQRILKNITPSAWIDELGNGK
jgi:hypothetical protein